MCSGRKSAGAAVVTSFKAAPPPGGGGASSASTYAIIAAAAVLLALCAAVGYLEHKKAMVSRLFDVQHNLEETESWAWVEDAKSPPSSRAVSPMIEAPRKGGYRKSSPRVWAERVWMSPRKQPEEAPRGDVPFLANNKRIRVAELAYDRN